MAIEQLEDDFYQDPRFDEQGKVDPRYLGAKINSVTGEIEMYFPEGSSVPVPVRADYIVPVDPITERWLKSQHRAY